MVRPLFIINSLDIPFWQKKTIDLAAKCTGHKPLVYLHPKTQAIPLGITYLNRLSRKFYKPSIDALSHVKLSLPQEAELAQSLSLEGCQIINLTSDFISSDAKTIWAFVYGKSHKTDSLTLGVSRVLSGYHIANSSLVSYDQEKISVLATGTSSCHQLAFYRSTCELLLRQSMFVSRALSGRKDNEENIAMSPSFFKLETPPSLFKITGLMFRVFFEKLVQKGRKKQSRWTLAYTRSTDFDAKALQRLSPPEGLFWADPFPYSFDGQNHVFFEEKEIGKGKGYLVFKSLDPNGNERVEKMLEEPYHLSYPHIFEYHGERYMIPETMENESINLYKCKTYPGQWAFEKYLMKAVKAVDSTLFYHKEKWWLFTNMLEVDGASIQDELFLFYADSPLSDDWTPHPKNPIVTDVRTSRPAGNIFVENERIIRPSQNSALRYGHMVNLQEVLILSETEYQETSWKEIKPWSGDIHGIHTYNRSEKLTFVDLRE